MAAIEYLTVDRLSTKDLIRIFSKITINPEIQWNGTPCWVWVGSRGTFGHGRMRLRGIAENSHRVLFAWLVHPLPRGMKYGELDHLCRNPPCCNPLHLEFVSGDVNKLRGMGLPAKNARLTHCSKGHSFVGDHVYITPKGRRVCRICRNERVRVFMQKHPKKYDDKRREYQRRNKERLNAYQVQYYHANHEHKLEYHRKYRAKRRAPSDDSLADQLRT